MSEEALVDRAWRLAYLRAPDAAEKKSAAAFLDRQEAILRERLRQDQARAAALADLCHMLFNSNEFVYMNLGDP